MRCNYRRLSILLVVLLGIGAVGLYKKKTDHQFVCQTSTLYPAVVSYSPEKHEAPIIDFFNDNYYWLLGYPGYSPEFMLRYRASQQHVNFAGQLGINVAEEAGVFVGFVTYYMDTPTVGRVLFLGVNEKFRGKRYGEQLFLYAIDRLRCMGAKKIWLVTRVDNLSAQKLYFRHGFQQTSVTDGFIHLEREFL